MHMASGWIAQDFHALDRDIRIRERYRRAIEDIERRERARERAEENARVKEFRDRLKATARVVDGYFDRVTGAIDRALEALGYRRHDRGPWRRRRGGTMSTALARVNIPEIARLAREGDRLALETLGDRAPDWLRRLATEGDGYVDETIEELLIRRLGPNCGRLQREAIAARMAVMREELAPSGSSPIEELLATRVALCWLHLMSLELEMDGVEENMTAKSGKFNEMVRMADAVDRRLSRAQGRYVQALTALARVRRLKIPVVFQQLNMATNQQVNFNKPQEPAP